MSEYIICGAKTCNLVHKIKERRSTNMFTYVLCPKCNCRFFWR